MAACHLLATHPRMTPVVRYAKGHGVFTNPLLECDIAADTISAPRMRFERQFKDQVSAIDGREGITEVAAYYRDLNNGPAFGINQNKGIFPSFTPQGAAHDGIS